jgi:hypothetical protein
LGPNHAIPVDQRELNYLYNTDALSESPWNYRKKQGVSFFYLKSPECDAKMNDQFLASNATRVESRQTETPVTFTCLPLAVQAARPFRYPANIPGYVTFLRLHKSPNDPTSVFWRILHKFYLSRDCGISTDVSDMNTTRGEVTGDWRELHTEELHAVHRSRVDPRKE